MQEEIEKLNLSDSPNISFNAVSDVITQVVNNAIPIKTVKIRNKQVNKPWITLELQNLIRERQKLIKSI